MTFSQLPPLAKLAAWMAMVVVLAAVVQLSANVVVPDFEILSGSGRGYLLALALASLLAVMAADKRPISQFGLFIGPRWKKLWLSGLAMGVATMSFYFLVAALSGAVCFKPDRAVLSRVPKAFLSAMTAMPLALVQQIIFSGYLLSMLRERYRAITAVVVSAFLFAVLGRLNRPDLLFQIKGQSLVIGLFLVGTLLGLLRLKTGNIIFPAGVLAGWMFVRRLGEKSHFLDTVTDSPLTAWMAPFSDVRQAPFLWLALAAGIAACWCLLAWRGEAKVPAAVPAMDADFKRIFPFAHSNGLATLDVWLPLLVAVRFKIGLVYVPKLLAVLVCSTINTILTMPERVLLPLLLRNRKVRDPVFVVGMHRSGTTHLHNLMSLDPQFCTPKNMHVMNPMGMVFSGWIVGPILGAFMPWQRPMDAVRFHLFSPQEDEFAVAGSTTASPHWGMTFPQQWPKFESYVYPDRLPARQLRRWKNCFSSFLKKLTFWNQSKRPLLKNPYATGRVRLLNDMFSQAKFVHIYRNPYDVYRSNRHLAREGHVVNQLQDPEPSCSYEARLLPNYRRIEEAFYEGAKGLEAWQLAEVAFEELERDPRAVLRAVYDKLDLPWTDEFENRLERYLAGVADYQKNRHRPLPDDERCCVENEMRPFMERWGYQPTDSRRVA